MADFISFILLVLVGTGASRSALGYCRVSLASTVSFGCEHRFVAPVPRDLSWNNINNVLQS